MSPRPVNLNKFRKDKARAGHEARADANAAKHGQSKAQTRSQTGDRDTAQAFLDAHRLDRDA